MKKTTLSVLGLTGIAVFGASMILPSTVSAHPSTSSGLSKEFASQLAEKLGLPGDQVQTAVDEVREEHRSEMEAAMQAKIDEAVANGDLTERQAELIAAMHEVRADLELERPDESEMQDLSDEERKDLREEHHAGMQQQMIDALNEQGLNTSAEELEELRTAMESLNLGGSRDEMRMGR